MFWSIFKWSWIDWFLIACHAYSKFVSSLRGSLLAELFFFFIQIDEFNRFLIFWYVVWRVKGKISGSNGKFSCLFTHYPFFWSPWLHSILDALWNHVVIIWKHLDFKPGIRLNARLLHYVSTLEKVVYTPLVTRLLVTSLFFLHLVPTHCVKHGHYGRTYFFFPKKFDPCLLQNQQK